MNYIGIDLGTTNSVISTFDGEHTRVWKNKRDQSDVTPTAIYVDKRGRRLYGSDAYHKLAQEKQNTASLFKRFMGTLTKIDFAGETHTPEECSAEILRELFKNLPEEIRSSDDNAIVITVPAAFDQMQNAATLEAAQMAGLGSRVALMQEPVAAIMSIMKERQENGIFLIYDLGGGTLDIAIGESLEGKVNLLAHGGIAMCGGRDFDRVILNKKIIPWIREHYQVPADLTQEPSLRQALAVATYWGEMAKIELSVDGQTAIQGETPGFDSSGQEIYLDIPFTRQEFNDYIRPYVHESIEAAKETIHEAGLTTQDFDRIIFIGGPTNYKPLRDMVSQELGIPVSLEVNPMTAVSEGASIYAESIEWEKDGHERKSERGEVQSAADLGLTFVYVARTADTQARIAAHLVTPVTGYTFDVSTEDGSWRSGIVSLQEDSQVEVPLQKKGDNVFSVVVYDSQGQPVQLEHGRIVIVQTVATIGSIAASHSIGIEVKCSSESDDSTLDYLVREGDELPARGTKYFRAVETIRAQDDNSLNFKLWEGDIDTAVEDNRFIGCMTVSGHDFEFGMIMKGAQIVCDYVVSDSGSIELNLSVPSIDEEFCHKNYYSREEGAIDMARAGSQVAQDARDLLRRIKKIGRKLEGEARQQLKALSERVSQITLIDNIHFEPEDVKKASDDLLLLKRQVNVIKKKNRQVIRQYELQVLQEYYRTERQQWATEDETKEYGRLFSLAEKAKGKHDAAFENILEQIRYLNYRVGCHNPRFISSWFINRYMKAKYLPEYTEQAGKLIERGIAILNDASRADELLKINHVLSQMCVHNGEDVPDVAANIIRG